MGGLRTELEALLEDVRRGGGEPAVALERLAQLPSRPRLRARGGASRGPPGRARKRSRGLAKTPVIGVPTSVGYGSARGGESALHAMLCSCAAGVAVAGIDDGFGAGTVAARIARGAASGP